MEFFSFLKRRKKSPAGANDAQAAGSVKVTPANALPIPIERTVPFSPEEVRRLLFDAVAAGDEARLEALCREYQNVFVEHSSSWLEVPPEFRANDHLSAWYANGLAAIAKYCAEKLSESQLTNGTRRNEPASADAETQS